MLDLQDYESQKFPAGADFDEIADEEITKRELLSAGIECKKGTDVKNNLPICKFCCFHTIFKHDGEDPIFKKGIWVKTGNGICTRHHSLEMQNNRGIWYICDTETAQKCHLYEAR